MNKPSGRERREALEKWSTTPATNPRYKAATPADVVRALLGKKASGEERGPDESGGRQLNDRDESSRAGQWLNGTTASLRMSWKRPGTNSGDMAHAGQCQLGKEPPLSRQVCNPLGHPPGLCLSRDRIVGIPP